MIPRKAKTTLNAGRAVGILLLLFTPLLAGAQVSPEMHAPPSLSTFGTYTAGSSDWSNNTSYGFSIGGYLQTRHYWGLETRGSFLRWGPNEHRYDVLFGPRVALRFSRVTPYGAFLGGVGHAVWFQSEDGNNFAFTNGTAGEWKVLGGVDLHMSDRLSVRLGEISYAKIYVHNLTPVDFSAGIVYRLPAWGN